MPVTPEFASSMMALLEEQGVHLSAAEQAHFLPDLEQKFHERLALELAPLLSDEQQTQFAALIDAPETNQAAWNSFFRASISDFDERVADIGSRFAADVRALLSQSS